MSSLFIPRLIVFGVSVIGFFVGLYFNKRDDEHDKVLYDQQRKRAEIARQQEFERLQALYKERARFASAVTAMTEESQPVGLGGGAAAQAQGQQPKRTVH